MRQSSPRMICTRMLFAMLVLGVAGLSIVVPERAWAGDSFKIVVVVNGTPITKYDIDEQMDLVATSLRSRPETAGLSPAEMQHRLDQERPKIIETMIEEQLMKEEIDRLELSVDDEMVDNYLATIRKENHLEDDAVFNQELAKMDITLQQFRDKIKNDMQKQRLVQGMVSSKLVITETEVEEEFAKYPESQGGLRQHLRAIIVPTSEEMEDVTSALDDGMSFSDAAQKYSQGPVPEEGGDLGFIATINLAPAWRNALEGVEVGGISEPFEVDGNVVVLQLVEESLLSIDDVPGMRDKVFKKLRSEKMSVLFDEYMGRLREMAVVEWK